MVTLESILTNFFLGKINNLSVYAVKLGYFIVIALFSYVTKVRYSRAKTGKQSLVGFTPEVNYSIEK